jgi:hypothetical protein
MSDIINSVARVIDPLAFTDWKTPPRGLETAPRHIVEGERMRRQHKAEKTARAVVLMMREPTPDMRVDGGIAWALADEEAETYVDNADACWKAMIDKVLG